MQSVTSQYYEVEDIKDKKFVRGKWMYYVKWKNFSSDKNTWEPLENLGECTSMLSRFESAYNKRQLKQKKSNKKGKDIEEVEMLRLKPENIDEDSELSQRNREDSIDNVISSKMSGLKRLKKIKQIAEDSQNKLKVTPKNSIMDAQQKSKNKQSESQANKIIDIIDDTRNNMLQKNNKPATSSEPRAKLMKKKNETHGDNNKNTDIIKTTELKKNMDSSLEKLNPDKVDIKCHRIINGNLMFKLINTGDNQQDLGNFTSKQVRDLIPTKLCMYYEKFLKIIK